MSLSSSRILLVWFSCSTIILGGLILSFSLNIFSIILVYGLRLFILFRIIIVSFNGCLSSCFRLITNSLLWYLASLWSSYLISCWGIYCWLFNLNRIFLLCCLITRSLNFLLRYLISLDCLDSHPHKGKANQHTGSSN